MRKVVIFLSLLITLYGVVAFAGKPDYSGHFDDMDANKDEFVTWDEFKAHFSFATPEVFKEADADKNRKLDHDEWHAFKEKHGYKCPVNH
jgi:hypothetical protein